MKVFEPQRAKYTKKIGKWNICEFCNANNIKKQECKTASGRYWMVFINKFPYMDGNLMIIPRRHVKDTSDLSDDEKKEFFEVLEKVKNKLGKIFKTKEFNIWLNLGKNSGCSISHLHWQIIPRKFKIENATNIFGDIHILTVLPEKLRKMIDGKD